MASPTTPTHGKLGAIYAFRPNGFAGAGLNDLSWGTSYSGGGSSAAFQVEIDGSGTPDTFKWNKNGGAYTSGVAITGAAQTLSDSQTITFAATTGHTVGDKWSIGNLDSEACTESGTDAQITSSYRRILNPNASPTFTDDGGANVLKINYTTGTGVFDDNVGTVTVSGNNGYIVVAALEKIGYGFQWSLDFGNQPADASKFQDAGTSIILGQYGASGSFESYFIGGKSGINALKEAAAGDFKYFFVELYNYDPDDDATGDRFNVWAKIDGLSVNAPVGDVVKEQLSFTAHGPISFSANS
jgi:hypothetical protein